MSQFSFVQLLIHRLGEYAVQRGGLRKKKKVAGRQLFTFFNVAGCYGTSAETGKALGTSTLLVPYLTLHLRHPSHYL